MQPSEVRRAVAAAVTTAASLGLTTGDAVVLHNSNRLAVRLWPCDSLARVAPLDHRGAQFEVDLTAALAESGSPVGGLDPRVAPRVHERDGWAVTLWTYYEPASADGIPASAYAGALERLHAGMRGVEIPTPHFTDRVAEAQRLVADPGSTPALPAADRELLAGTLDRLRRSVAGSGRPEQVLHGEPHPGNLLATGRGPLFIDLETCCRGPVEFDVAHAPEDVAENYPGVDREVLRDCRLLVLAMITAWRWDRDDQFPDGLRHAGEGIGRIRAALA